VVNDIARSDIGFDAEHNEITILAARPVLAGDRAGGAGANGAAASDCVCVPRASKAQVAEAVLDAVEALRARA
jgi:hypothetical protein